MKDRGAEKDIRLVLSRHLKKRLERVARQLQLTLPETVLLAIATRLPAVEAPGPQKAGSMADNCRSPESGGAGECRRPGAVPRGRRPGGKVGGARMKSAVMDRRRNKPETECNESPGHHS